MCHFYSRNTLALVSLAVLAGIGFSPLKADTVTLSDPYLGQNNSGSGAQSQSEDVIGPYSRYDIDEIVFTFNSSKVTAQLRFNHSAVNDDTTADLTLGPYYNSLLPVGDLLFDVNGVFKYGVPLVGHDGLTAGSLYQIQNVLMSDLLMTGVGDYWRFGVPVHIDPLGAVLLDTGTAPNTIGLGFAEVETTLDFTPSAGFWQDLQSPGLSVHFPSTVCANDILAGRIAATPEPGVIVLLGTVLLIVAPLMRRRLRA